MPGPRPTALPGLLAGTLCATCTFLTVAVAAEQRVVVKGSNTFGEELAPALIKQFREKYPDVSVDLESSNSASGLNALLEGNCDIASSSRPINDDEKRLARSRGIKLNEMIIGFYGVAVLVNETNPLKDLSDNQVRDIFTGAVTNWKAVGGADAPIHLYIRNPASGTYLGFQELAMQKKPYAASAKLLARYTDIVAKLSEDPHGIGYSSMPPPNAKGVKAVRINGIPMTGSTVNRGDYPYARSLRLYTNSQRESDAARKFTRFVLGRKGQDVLNEVGFVRRFEIPLLSPEL
jgi:phosphate transport system substrate-binding protein